MTRTKKALIFVLTAICILCVSMFTLVACGGNKKPKSISLDTKEVKTSYVKGEALDLTGLKVTVQYEGKDDVLLTADEYTVSPANGTVLSETKTTSITVSYKYSEKEDPLTKSFNVSVHNNVASIAVKTQPEKTSYWSGEEAFDTTALEVEATLEDGTKQAVAVADLEYSTDILKYTGDEYAENAPDEDQNITLTYAGKTVDVPVKVKANPIVDIKLVDSPRLVYMQGESFDLAGIKFNAVYKSTTQKAIGSNDLASATHNAQPFTTQKVGDKVPVKVSFIGRTFDFEVTIVEGLAVEAEDGVIKSTSVKYETDAKYDPNQQGEWDDKYLASGDVYLAELNAGDTVSFTFLTDKAGKVSIAFRMSSKYLKADSGWIPKWMGDCQFNKIAKFYVNGTEYPIDDTVILPGGGSADAEPNFYLWFNWAQVAFNNIDVKKGENTITIEYVKHEYNDCSQSGFNGTFSSNLDCLKVVSEDVIVDLNPEIDKVTVTDINLIEQTESVPKLVFTADVTQAHNKVLSLTDEEVIGALEKALKVNLGTIESVDYEDGVATITVSLDGIVVAGDYEVRIGYGSAAALTIDVSDKATASFDVVNYKLENIMSEPATPETPATPAEQAEGNEEPVAPAEPKIIGVKLVVALGEDANYEMKITLGTDAKVEVRENKVYYIVTGSAYSETTNITLEALLEQLRAASLNDIVFDIQQAGGNYGYISDYVVNLLEDNAFEIALDITNAAIGTHGTHLYLNSAKEGDGNFAPKNPAVGDADPTIKVIEAQSVVLGLNKFTVSFNAESTWGCVNITVESLFGGVNAESATLTKEDDKAIYTVKGTYTVKEGVNTNDEATAELIKKVIAETGIDFQMNCYAAANTWDGPWDTVNLVNKFVSVSISSKTVEGEDGSSSTVLTYEVKYDVTDLSNYHYTGHYNGGDFKPGVEYDQTITIGDKVYQMVVVPTDSSGAQFWGCVGLIISDAPAEDGGETGGEVAE